MHKRREIEIELHAQRKHTIQDRISLALYGNVELSVLEPWIEVEEMPRAMSAPIRIFLVRQSHRVKSFHRRHRRRCRSPSRSFPSRFIFTLAFLLRLACRFPLGSGNTSIIS